MSLEAHISLLTATLDLTVVKSIRDAIRTADVAGGKRFPVTAIGPAPNPPLAFGDADRFESRRRFHPEAVIEPRQVIHPAPTYAPRPVIHTHPRLALETLVPAQPEGVRVTQRLFEPPWRTVPWKNPIPSPVKIKIVLPAHDKSHRGMILDLFI